MAGQGIGTAALISEKYLGANALHAPHNDYLRLSLECGYFVALLYVIFLINEILFNLRRARLQRNWFINMPVFMMVIYFPVISAVQNIVYNVTVFPMMLAIMQSRGSGTKYWTARINPLPPTRISGLCASGGSDSIR